MSRSQWLSTSFGYAVDRDRAVELIHGNWDQAEAVQHDRALQDRYRRSGVDAVMLCLRIKRPNDPAKRTVRRPMRPSQWGEDSFDRGLYIEAAADDPGTTGPEFDAWLAQQVRAVLESWPKLAQ